MLEHLGEGLGVPLRLAVAGSGPLPVHSAEKAAPLFTNLLKIYAPQRIDLLGEGSVIRLHAVSDLLIGLACCGIPVALVLLARKRRDLPFRGMLWVLAAFLLACGATHFFSLAALWAPIDRLEGLVKLVTALLSVLTAAALWRSLPHILALPSPRGGEARGRGAVPHADRGDACSGIQGLFATSFPGRITLQRQAWACLDAGSRTSRVSAVAAVEPLSLSTGARTLSSGGSEPQRRHWEPEGVSLRASMSDDPTPSI